MNVKPCIARMTGRDVGSRHSADVGSRRSADVGSRHSADVGSRHFADVGSRRGPAGRRPASGAYGTDAAAARSAAPELAVPAAVAGGIALAAVLVVASLTGGRALAQGGGGTLLVQATLPLDASAAWSVDRVYGRPWSDQADPEPLLADADARLVLRDEAGAAVHSRLVAREWDCSAECVETDLVQAVVPASAGAARAELYAIDAAGQPTEMKAERRRSPASPTITVTKPSPGQELTQGMPIEWTASDADGDELVYDVMYRPSLGYFIQLPLAVGLRTTRIFFDRDALPADDDAQIAVVANDGWNTVEAVVDGLVLRGNQTPTVTIRSPENGSVFPPGTAVTLDAIAEDPEEGDLPVAWSSDTGGPISGATWSTSTIGRHVLAASATDASGATGTATVTVWIGAGPPTAIHLPLVQRR